MGRADSVYNAVNGDYISKEDYIIEGIEIENSFEMGSKCSNIYDNIYNAKQRLYKRLGTNDEDVDIIMLQYSQLAREIALKMFEYGYRFGYQGKEKSNG